VAALDRLAGAVDGLAAVVPEREAPGNGSGDAPLPLQNLPAHLIFARHWETHRGDFLRRLTARPCPLCGAVDRSTWFHTQDGYRYDICASCGMVHIPEVLPLTVWDEYYAALPQALDCLREQMTRSVQDEAWARDQTRFGRYLSMLQSHGAAPEGARVLDLGSFTGAWLRVAGAHGLDASGIEGLAEAVRFARERFPDLHLEHARTEQLDPAMFGRTFEVVTMWETLEHTFDPVQSLRLAARVLGPRGWLALTVPNVRNVQFSALGQFCFYAYGGYQGTGHVNMFSPDTLERALDQAGFELIDISTEFGTDWRQVLHYLRQQFDRIHCYATLVRRGDQPDSPAPELSIVLNWLSPALTRLENACLAGPIVLALARLRT
jgi:2-polyprenyl-3-methyl-5-hydroxy-6-metoxy-1,4-benzoquinol methylase